MSNDDDYEDLYEDWPDPMQEMWDSFKDELAPNEQREWSDEAAYVFELGWMTTGEDVDSETREWAREEFFALMEEFDIDISLFDWDDWRDWYDGAA
jgi:hypothetical protein